MATIETVELSNIHHNTKYNFSILTAPVKKDDKTVYSSFLVEGVGDSFRSTVCIWAARERKKGNNIRLKCVNKYNEAGKRIGIRVVRIV